MPNLYKNSEGKVLLSAGSKIIKQPYSFSKAFTNRMGLNNYININHVLSSEYSIILQHYTPHLTYGDVHRPFCNITNGTDNIEFGGYDRSGGYIAIAKNSQFFTSSLSLISYLNEYNVAYYYHDNTTYNSQTKSNNLSSGKVAYSQFNISSTKLYVGAIRVSAGATPNIFMMQDQKIAQFAIFNRELTSSEYLYYYNNGLFNDLQSLVGVMILYKNDKAEILDFSVAQDGSDLRVGVRDYSGFNRHGELMNLPAGTTQYKLDYANTNLFV